MFGWIAHGSLVAWLVTAPGTNLERALFALWISATITTMIQGESKDAKKAKPAP